MVLTSLPALKRVSTRSSTRVDSAESATNASLSSAATRCSEPCSGASTTASSSHAASTAHRERFPVANCASRSMALAQRQHGAVGGLPRHADLQLRLEAVLVGGQRLLDRLAGRQLRGRAALTAAAQ